MGRTRVRRWNDFFLELLVKTFSANPRMCPRPTRELFDAEERQRPAAEQVARISINVTQDQM